MIRPAESWKNIFFCVQEKGIHIFVAELFAQFRIGGEYAPEKITLAFLEVRIFSSTLSLVINLVGEDMLFWPKRWTRSVA